MKDQRLWGEDGELELLIVGRRGESLVLPLECVHWTRAEGIPGLGALWFHAWVMGQLPGQGLGCRRWPFFLRCRGGPATCALPSLLCLWGGALSALPSSRMVHCPGH